MNKLSMSPLRFGWLKVQSTELEEELNRRHHQPLATIGLAQPGVIRGFHKRGWDVEVQQVGKNNVQVEIVNQENPRDILDLPFLPPIPLEQASGERLAYSLVHRLRRALFADSDEHHPVIATLKSLVMAPAQILTLPEATGKPTIIMPEKKRFLLN